LASKSIGQILPYGSEESIRGFVSNLGEVIEDIRRDRPTVEVLVDSDSDVQLEIVYPEHVLYGMLSELVPNAAKYSAQDRTTVLIQWNVTGNRFRCEVHDDGAASALVCEQKSVPLDIFHEVLGRHDTRATQVCHWTPQGQQSSLLLVQRETQLLS